MIEDTRYYVAAADPRQKWLTEISVQQLMDFSLWWLTPLLWNLLWDGGKRQIHISQVVIDGDLKCVLNQWSFLLSHWMTDAPVKLYIPNPLKKISQQNMLSKMANNCTIWTHPSIPPAYPGLDCEGSSLSREAQTSLSPVTCASSSGGIPGHYQDIWET